LHGDGKEGPLAEAGAAEGRAAWYVEREAWGNPELEEMLEAGGLHIKMRSGFINAGARCGTI
jgi:hypothetical protein